MTPSEASIGSRVRWTYKHHLNSRSYTYLTKDGVLLGFVKNKSGYGYAKAIVQFDGNKTKSKAPLDEIVRL